ncbi:MAG: threonine/serine exporter family protein [Clostridiaceae bacterium]
MNNEAIIKSAILAGKIILEAGGETYRVEDTMNRILSAYGIVNAQSFVTPTGIMMSGEHADGSTISQVRRIKEISVDLEKISLVNDLSRKIIEKHLTAEEFTLELEAILARPYYPLWVTLCFSGFATFSFTVILHGSWIEALSAFTAGILVYITRRIARSLHLNSFLQNAMGGFIAVVIGTIFKAVGIIPTTSIMIIGTIMLLVPGITITNAIRDTFQGDYLSGITRAVEAFVTAAGIAFGTGLGFILMGVI